MCRFYKKFLEFSQCIHRPDILFLKLTKYKAKRGREPLLRTNSRTPWSRENYCGFFLFCILWPLEWIWPFQEETLWDHLSHSRQNQPVDFFFFFFNSSLSSFLSEESAWWARNFLISNSPFSFSSSSFSSSFQEPGKRGIRRLSLLRTIKIRAGFNPVAPRLSAPHRKVLSY